MFTDGSVHTDLGIGYGAYLIVKNLDIKNLEQSKDSIKLQRFDSTSSTKLELETLLWAISKVKPQLKKPNNQLKIYTDSQNIVGLPGRRKVLQQKDYYSKNNKRLANYLLYKEFYEISDQLNIELIKVKGHKAVNRQSDADRHFALVDRAARRAMKENQKLKHI